MKGYGSHLIFSALHKFNLKTNVIPNGLEKYMGFFLNKNLVFIDSMQFTNSSLDKIVKNLSDDNFKYLAEEFDSKYLKIFKKKVIILMNISIVFKNLMKINYLLENIFLDRQKKERLIMMVKYQMFR